MQKIFLICHPGALGDFILTWPTLIGLRKILPEHQFTAVGRAETMRLARRLELIDDFVDGESRESIGFFSGSQLPPGIADPDGGLVWLKEADAVCALIRKTATRPVVPIDPVPEKSVHVARHACRAVRKYFPNAVSGKLSEGFPEHQPIGRSVFIHPGSGSETKNYPPDLYKKIADLLRRSGWNEVNFLMGPAEMERGLLDRFHGEKLVFPENSIKLADCLDTASVYIGNDSGPSHLAGYMGIPSIVLYKTTDPKVWGVVGKKVWHVFEENEETILKKIFSKINRWTAPPSCGAFSP